MEYIMNKVQAEYGFSDYQIKLIRFSLTGLFYDASKTLIFFLYFHAAGRLPEFLFAVVPLILLRTRTGGIHFRKYWSCFLFSFAYLYLCINVLPVILTIHPLVIYPVLLLCAVTDFLIGPASLKEKPSVQDAYYKDLQKTTTKKARIQSFQVVFLVAVLIFIFPEQPCLIVSFWTVVLHTIQLSVIKLMKEVKCREKVA